MSDRYGIRVKQPMVGSNKAGGGSGGGGLLSGFPADALVRRTGYYYFDDFDTVPAGATTNAVNALQYATHVTGAGNTVTIATTVGVSSWSATGAGGRLVLTNDGTQFHGVDQFQLCRGVIMPPTPTYPVGTIALGGTSTRVIDRSVVMMEVSVQINDFLSFLFIGLLTSSATNTANAVLTAATGAVTANPTGAWFYGTTSPGATGFPQLQWADAAAHTVRTVPPISDPNWGGADFGTAVNFDKFGIRVIGNKTIEWYFNDRRVGRAVSTVDVFGTSLPGAGTMVTPSLGWISNGTGSAGTLVVDYLMCGQNPRVVDY